LNPGPLPLGPGIETQHTNRSPKAADVTRFWLGRSVARRLLGLTTTEKAGRDIIQRRNRRPLLAGNFLNGKAEIFQKKRYRGKTSLNPQAWF
jgi:hypothetical protein